MKKFLVFILFLIVLVASEYYFLNEIFSQQRIMILFLSLLGVIICIFGFLRFFKKIILHGK